MKRNLFGPFGTALATGGVALVIGVILLQHANEGIPAALGWGAWIYLFTLGLPTVLGVACVATVWGGGLGLGWFGPTAVLAGLLFQYAACLAIRGMTARRGGRVRS
jgi:hypothetical protein